MFGQLDSEIEQLRQQLADIEKERNAFQDQCIALKIARSEANARMQDLIVTEQKAVLALAERDRELARVRENRNWSAEDMRREIAGLREEKLHTEDIMQSLQRELAEARATLFNAQQAVLTEGMARDALALKLEKCAAALEVACGNRCNAEYTPCYARETIATLNDDHNKVIADHEAGVWEEAANIDLGATYQTPSAPKHRS